LKCLVSARVLAVSLGQGASLPPPYNVTQPAAVEEVRDFIERALAAQTPSDLHLPPKLSELVTPDGRYIITLSLRRIRFQKAGVREVIRPAIVVKPISEEIWEIDFE